MDTALFNPTETKSARGLDLPAQLPNTSPVASARPENSTPAVLTLSLATQMERLINTSIHQASSQSEGQDG